MSDIYDGEIWKTFPSSLNIPNTARFFAPETADRHLGIMINLDWFQPFKSAVYSCGAIYGVICNLPRDIRFKRENMGSVLGKWGLEIFLVKIYILLHFNLRTSKIKEQ